MADDPKKPGSERTEKVASEAGSLLYLYCNNSIQTPKNSVEEILQSVEQAVDKKNILSPYHRKSAHSLAENVASLISSVGLDRIGFLTLTFPDNVTDHKEASRRFNSFSTNFLAPHSRFGNWLYVKERQKRGAWHFHILIDCGCDIRTGIDFEAIGKRCYRSANSQLRSIWAELRVGLPKYGFGRHELLPVLSNAKAMSLYVGKYISKHVGVRRDEDKGVRLVCYSKKWPRSNTSFQWHTGGSFKWRRGVEHLAEFLDCETMDELTKRLGRRWAWDYREDIFACRIPDEVREQVLQEYEFEISPLFEKVSQFISEMKNTLNSMPSFFCSSTHHADNLNHPKKSPERGIGPRTELQANVLEVHNAYTRILHGFESNGQFAQRCFLSSLPVA